MAIKKARPAAKPSKPSGVKPGRPKPAPSQPPAPSGLIGSPIQTTNVGAYAQKTFEFLNVPLSKAANAMKKYLRGFDANKTVYIGLFVASIAFIANGIYAMITMALAVLVAGWSLKNLIG